MQPCTNSSSVAPLEILLTAAATLPYRRRAIARETLTKTAFALLALGLLARPALAFHRTTPPIIAVTSSGDTLLPRVSTEGRQLVVALDVSGKQIFRQHRTHDLLEQITTSGDNDNPTISRNSRVIAWDSDCSQLGCPEPGRQIFMWTAGTAFQVTHDPTGSSVNPALSGRGTRLAFESHGDLAGQNPSGTSSRRRVGAQARATMPLSIAPVSGSYSPRPTISRERTRGSPRSGSCRRSGSPRSSPTGRGRAAVPRSAAMLA